MDKKLPNDQKIKFNGFTVSLGQIRDLIKDKGIKPGELYGTVKDASNAHDFSELKWCSIKDFEELRAIIEEVKLDPHELFTHDELQADPETKEDDPDDTSHIPGEPDPEPLTEEEKKETDHIPGDEPKGSSSDKDEADHIPD